MHGRLEMQRRAFRGLELVGGVLREPAAPGAVQGVQAVQRIPSPQRAAAAVGRGGQVRVPVAPVIAGRAAAAHVVAEVA